MAEDLRKLVQIGVSKGYSLDKMRNDFANAGWSEAYLDSIPSYYNEFKKKSPAGTGLRAAGVSPSRQTVTPSSSGFASQETKNIPLEDPLLTKKDGYAKSLMEQLNLAAKDKNNRNKYVPTINKLWNEYSSIDRGAPAPSSIFEDNGAISKNSLNLLKESSARNAERVKREAIAIAKDDGVLETAARSFYSGILGAANYLGDLIDPDSYDDVPDAKTDLEKEAEAQSARAQKASYGRKLLDGYTDKQIEDGFFKNFADGNVSTALGLFGRDLLEVLPQNAVGFIPYVGLPLMAASAGGQGWLAVKDDEKYNTLEKFLYAPLVGTAEYVTEKFLGMDRKMVQEGLSKAFGKTITSAADIPKKELGDMIFGTLPKAARAPLEEGLEEGLVSTFTQTLDKIMAEKPFDPVEIAESVMLGAGAGGSTYALVRGSSALLQTPLFSDVYKITNTAAKIDNILKSEDISDEERVILTDRLNGYKTQMRKLQDGASDYYKQFSQEDKQKTLELNQTISRGIRSYSTMKTAEAKAETVNRIKQSLAEKAQIEQKYDSAQKQQVPSPVVQGAQPGGVSVQGTGTETPQAGGVLQVPSQQEEKVVEAAKQPNVGFRPTKAKLTSETLPQVLSGLKSYVESIPEETLQKFETTRQSITDGFESVANVISSFAKEGLNVEVEAINTEDEWNKATMDPTTGESQKLSRGLYYQRGQEGAPSKIILFAPALLGNTVYHEGIHEIVPQAFGQEGINKVAKALAKAIRKDEALNSKFGNFLSQYEEGDKSEELLAELGAMVAAGDIDVEITKSLATRFMEAVASVLGAVGIKMAPNASQLSEAFLSYSQKLGAGAKLDIQKMEESRTRVQGLIGELFTTLGIDLGKPLTPKEAEAARVKRQDLGLPKKPLDAYNQFKKAYGETNAKIIRSNMPSALEYPELFNNFVNERIAIKEQIGDIIESIPTQIETDFLTFAGKLETKEDTTSSESIGVLFENSGFVFHEIETEQEALAFKSDYKQADVICTFNNLQERLTNSHVFWIRRKGFETILPASEVTLEYLKENTVGSNLWMDYLRQQGMQSLQELNTLLPLSPSREDPYGTSSLSVQIKKSNKRLKVINRYNHKVDNPDYTYDANLDNIINGLDEAIYNLPKVGGKDGVSDSDKANQTLKGVDGKYFFSEYSTVLFHISRYGYMPKSGMSLSDYKAVPIDKSSEKIVGEYLINSKTRIIKPLFSVQWESQSAIRRINSIQFSKDSVLIETADGSIKLGNINKEGGPESIEGDITYIGDSFGNFLRNTRNLNYIDLPNVEYIGDDFGTQNVFGVFSIYLKSGLSFPSLKRVGDNFLANTFEQGMYISLDFPSLEISRRGFLSGIYSNNSVLSFPKLESTSSIGSILAITSVKTKSLFIPNLELSNSDMDDFAANVSSTNRKIKSVVNDKLFSALNGIEEYLLSNRDSINTYIDKYADRLKPLSSFFGLDARPFLYTNGQGVTVFNSKGEYFDPSPLIEAFDIKGEEFSSKFVPNEFPSVEVAPSEGGKKGPKRQAVTLRTKEESLAEFGFPVGDKVTNIRQVGAALEKRQQKKYIKIAKNDTSDKAKDIISNYMVDEVVFELESLGESSAKGWYGEKFQKALDLLSESIPSLKDKGNRNLFTMLVAITSDGQKVINNFTYAISLYNSYLKDGVVSDKFNFGGDRNSGMKINVGNINRLIKEYDNDLVKINDFLLQTDSYGNIKKKYNIKKSDYKVTTTMPISAGVFGPKLGAFFANLSGQENYLTMDRWWSRTFNRYRGILLPTVKEQGKQKFLNAIGKPNISNNAFLKEVKKYADSYIKKKYKNGTAIEKMANTIYKAAFVELNDKPFNAGDRDMMIETTQVAQEKLKKAGYDLSMADIQAILWYFEKRLYAEIQSKKSAMDVDYSNAVAKLIEGKKDLSFLPNEVSKIVNVKESEDEYVDAISSPSSNIIQLDEAVDLEAVDRATETINEAQKRKPPKRQGLESYNEKDKPLPGQRLFNEPLKEASKIADDYYKKEFGEERPKFEGVKSVNKERAKLISDAYIAMKDNYKDPMVKKAYDAMIKETLKQFDAIIDNGYSVVMSNNDRYNNSEEMIKDLRDNKQMLILSTEAEFGDNPITEKQRQSNPLLNNSGRKDADGIPLLNNDLFRFVHDFFGHAELGNSFGAIGEENAWNVHARMYSPLARRAMTTETRGQNSYVNFSGVNEEVFKIRDKAREERKKGNIEEADRLKMEVDEKMKFADQKVGLLPEWVSKTDEELSKQTQPKRQDISRVSALKDVESTAKALEGFIEDLRISSGLYFEDRMSANESRSAYAKQRHAFNRLDKKLGFDIGNLISQTPNQKTRVQALRDLSGMVYGRNRMYESYAELSEAYHEAKKDGSNPELVKAVEDLLVGEQQQPKRQDISKAQGPLVPVVYNSLLQQSTRNADGTNTPPYTLQEWLTMMTPYLNAQTATAIYNGVARNKPPFTAPSIQDAYDSSKKRMEAGKNKAFFTWNNLKKYFIDRQAELKKAILASGMKNAYNYLVNKAGSGARAAYFYYEKEKDIYKDLKKEQIEKLDQIIMLRRIIEIDSNFDERGEARPKHTNGFNKGYAEMELSRLQSELGDAAYNDLNNRATKYFDAFRSLLDSMYEEGLVSEELYEQLRDIDYQPRLFLDHVFEMDEPSMREMNLSAAQIKRIKEGSEGDIMFDSRFLLALYAKSAFSKIARNKANKEIAKATDAQGNESWVSKTDKPGFSEVTYFEDGVKKSFYLKDSLKSELDDISRVSGMPQNIQKLIGMVTGSFAVKLLATRANPLFVAKNVPRDYLHVLFFTKAYDNMSLPLAAMRLAGDFIKGVKSKLQDDQDFKDFVEFGGGMDFLSTEGMESMITNRTVTNKIIEKLGKAGELSEIGFRLAMYKKFKEDGMKALGPNATEDEVTRVKVQAVTQAREMIDFSQGGIATKNLEIVSPYINSAFQGFRVSTSYIQNNPKEFAKKLGYLSIGVMMLALYNAMLGDDDMEDIPEETKRKYFIIMTPFTFEEDGKTKRHYVKIAKTQQLAPFIAGLELTSDYFVAEVMGRKPRESKDAYEYAWKGATMYFPKDPSNIKKEISSSVPLFAAIAAYDMNYDTYRERAVSMDYNQVLPQDEDFTNKQVPYFYKALAQGIGASGGEAGPKRLQVATEKFVTTPYSSLLTMGAYTILDSFSRLFELKGPGGIPVKDQAAISNSVSKSLGLSASKVFTGATEPDWRSYTRKEEIERINMEEKSERRGIKIAAQNIGQKYFEAYNAKDSKAMSAAKSEYQDELMRIKKESGVPDAKYFMDAFQQARKYGKATNPEYNDISYAASNEAKARIIMEYGGRTMSRKELVEYINDYKRKTGKPINGSEILREYQKETGYGK